MPGIFFYMTIQEKLMKNTVKKSMSAAFAVILIGLYAVAGISAERVYVGDIDCDGRVSADDAREVLRFSVSLDEFTDEQKKIADTDSNGNIDSNDARNILRMSVGLEDLVAFEPVPEKPVEKKVADLTNKVRENVGRAPLVYREDFQKFADIRAKEIAEEFSHNRPDGRSCFTVFDDACIDYFTCGENIAFGYPTPEAVVEGWVNSPGHYGNMIDRDFQNIVVGVYNKDGTYYWVQLFITQPYNS